MKFQKLPSQKVHVQFLQNVKCISYATFEIRSRFALHWVLLLQSFSSATLLHTVHIQFFLVLAITDQLQQHAQAGKSARPPCFVNGLVSQAPPAGVFSANELMWTKVRDRGGICNVAAIPKDRIHDFVGGENERGNTTIKMEVKSNQQCLGVPTSLVGRCCYGRLRKTAQKEKAATAITEGDGRRSKISIGQSIKKGCLYIQYAFTITEYSRAEHVQACLNRSSRTDSVRPPWADLNVQQQQTRHAQPQQQLQHQQHQLPPFCLRPPQAEPLVAQQQQQQQHQQQLQQLQQQRRQLQAQPLLAQQHQQHQRQLQAQHLLAQQQQRVYPTALYSMFDPRNP
jgi:hypothetical protein